MALSNVNIAKARCDSLEVAPMPESGIVLQIRTGKRQALGPHQFAIAKSEVEGSIHAGFTGLEGDEHVYKFHGGLDRAIHQYDANHYSDWRAEHPPVPGLFDIGGFGENLTGTNMTEENVCVGDLYRIGETVLVEVSEPRNPCYKLNIRFQWPRALKRIQRTGRVGWNFRVLQTGAIKKGDTISLVERPHPRWSVMNVQRVIQGKSVPLPLLEECSALTVLTDKFRDMALRRLEAAPKIYTLVAVDTLTPRVKQYTFTLRESLKLANPSFRPFAFAQIRFGPELGLSRSYSIVSGDLRNFTLGVALDEYSTGGSAYLHQKLRVGEEIEMVPGENPRALSDEELCYAQNYVDHRIIIIGGIGVTAFLPAIDYWQRHDLSFEIHFAYRGDSEAAYITALPRHATTTYCKARNERLDIQHVVPPSSAKTKIYCCGPVRLMRACKQVTDDLGYAEHMTHFEDFSKPPTRDLGEPFELEVTEPDADRKQILQVSSDQTLLQVLHEAGFDNVMSSCRTGGCGACKVTLCAGQVKFKSTVLSETEKTSALQSCVDRGVGKILIEID